MLEPRNKATKMIVNVLQKISKDSVRGLAVVASRKAGSLTEAMHKQLTALHPTSQHIGPSSHILTALTCPETNLMDCGAVALGEVQAASELEPCWDLTCCGGAE